MRRPIVLYAMALIIGIVDAFIFFEQNSVTYSVVLGMAILAIFLMYRDAYYINLRQVKHSVLIACFGIFIFSAAYIRFEGIYESIYSHKGTDHKIIGVITEVEEGIDKTRFIVDEGYGRKTLCTAYNTLAKQTKKSDDGVAINEGNIVEVIGKNKVPDKARNPRCFNYRLYLKSRGVAAIASVRSIKIKGEKEGMKWKIKKALNSSKNDLLSGFESSPETAGFIKGVIFGDTSMLDEDISDEFRENGTAHILAVSGLHIGFIVSMLKFLTKTRKTIPVTFVIISLILLYGEMTNWNASTIRSVIVIVFALISFYVKRPYDLLSGLSAAAIIMLTYNPYWLFNISFQMSFLAMLGISFLGKIFEKIFGETIGILTGIQVVVSTFSAFSFNTLNPLSILLNIPIVFLAAILVPVSMLYLAIGGLTGTWVIAMRTAICSLSSLILNINHKLNFDGKLSLGVMSVEAPVFFCLMIIIFYLSSEQTKVWLIRRSRVDIRRSLSMVMLITFLISIPFFNKFSEDEIVFVDVGQGDAIHVRINSPFNQSKNFLFDGGGSRDYNIGKKTLRPYLLKNGAFKLDGSFISHLHTDHYKAVKELGEIYPVEHTYISEINRQELASSAGTINSKSVNFIDIGDKIKLGENITLQVVWPEASSKRRTEDFNDENEKNMVVLLEYMGIRVLITGDLTGEDEAKMLDYYLKRDGNYEAISCDILKSCHHGSKYSNTDDFLSAVCPSIVIIQAGKNNLYGHPHKETLKRFESHNIEVHRTDREGAIGINISKRGKFKIHSMLD